MRYFSKLGLTSALVGVFTLLSVNYLGAQQNDPQYMPGNRQMEHGSATLYVGGYSPTTHLGDGTRFDPSATVGASVGYWFNEYAGVRANGLYAQTKTDGPARFNYDNPNVWTYTGELLLRMPFSTRAGDVSPYVIGGVGGKSYDFQNRATHTKFAGDYGLGVEYQRDPGSRWGLALEVRDVISKFDMGTFNDTQQDVVWTGGIRINY